MPRTISDEGDHDLEYWLKKYQITRDHPKLFEYMVEQKNKYAKRAKLDKPLTTKAMIDGHLRDVPVNPLMAVMAEVQVALEEMDASGTDNVD